MIETQAELEQTIAEWGFMPFFRNGVEGFSVEELVPEDLLFSDEGEGGAWQWKGSIISHWQCAYGKFFAGKAGYVSLDWLPDFINWRRFRRPLGGYDADAQRILDVLRENESMLSRQLKAASGFTLSRKRRTFNPNDPTTPTINRHNGTAFDTLIARLQMGTHVCIADFELFTTKQGKTYGWGMARYCTPEAMYGESLCEAARCRTPEESRRRIGEYLLGLFPTASAKDIDKIIGT